MPEIPGQATISGASLYQMIHGGAGTWTMDRAHDAAKTHSTTQQEINEEIVDIANKLQQAWSGQASEGAHGATQPLRDGATISSESLHSAQDVHARQGQQFATTARQMDPLDDKPQTGVWDSVTPWDTDTEDAVNAYNQKSQRNVELYAEYGKTSDASQSSMPQRYGVFPEFQGNFAVASHQAGPGGGPQSAPPVPGDATSAASFGGSPSTAGGGNSPVPTGAGHPGPHGVGPGPGGGQQIQGQGPTTGANPGGAPPPGNPAAPSPAATPRPSPGPGIAPLPAGGGINSGETVRSGRGFGTGGRYGPGTGGKYGPSTGGRYGPGGFNESGARGGAPGRAGGMPGESVGGRTGATPGAAAAAEAAAARGSAAGTPGRAGASGAPMAPGNKGKGSEDEEHQRKTVLEEPDAEGLFGTDERTPPPVIGGSS